MTKIIDLYQEIKNLFKQSDIDSYDLDAKILIAHLLQLDNPQNVILKFQDDADIKISNDLKKLVERRLSGEPIAYIIKYKNFWKQRYFVNSDVLIPRPESELIIDVILKELKDKKREKLKLLDLGTGSGCIILSLLSELKFSEGIGVDISELALQVAKRNGRLFGMEERVKFIRSNWIDGIKRGDTFDIITCNPPYISDYEWRTLDRGVKDFEPRIALTDSKDGLSHYQFLLNNIKKISKKTSIIVFEIGYNQSIYIKKLFEQNNFKVDLYKDIYNIERVAVIK
ncbi:MAG: release factor glutamine methyltransferase [Candidatus Midichloriaceae bacterium]|jgi:release factor glutamine methyltransferase